MRIDHSRGHPVIVEGKITAAATMADVGIIGGLGRYDPSSYILQNLELWGAEREYPIPKLNEQDPNSPSWFNVGAYHDDFLHDTAMYNVKIYNVTLGVFVHGGSRNTMNDISVFGVMKPLVISGSDQKNNQKGQHPVPPEGNVWTNFTTDNKDGKILYDDAKVAATETIEARSTDILATRQTGGN